MWSDCSFNINSLSIGRGFGGMPSVRYETPLDGPWAGPWMLVPTHCSIPGLMSFSGPNPSFLVV